MSALLDHRASVPRARGLAEADGGHSAGEGPPCARGVAPIDVVVGDGALAPRAGHLQCALHPATAQVGVAAPGRACDVHVRNDEVLQAHMGRLLVDPRGHLAEAAPGHRHESLGVGRRGEGAVQAEGELREAGGRHILAELLQLVAGGGDEVDTVVLDVRFVGSRLDGHDTKVGAGGRVDILELHALRRLLRRLRRIEGPSGL
mmetsp:Transcript_118988/g.344160  ORF Transcript_118988/g.344160 Transcript_118988/m.344160 type:complete len:203 (-) Transcript_118988:1889-2497(-)